MNPPPARPSPQPLVSIITPFLNAEEFLAETIECVLAQTYARWELLLIDDGSSDRGGEIAKGYQARHPDRIRCLEHPGRVNRGLGASRNFGIESSRGELIAPLDGDDVWLPEKLERQVAILDREPQAQWVYGPALTWASWTEKPAHPDYRPRIAFENRLVSPPMLLDNFIPQTRGRYIPVPSAMLFRRALIERVGGYATTRSPFEDLFFFVKLAAASPAFVTADGLVKYRYHQDSMYHAALKGGTHAAHIMDLRRWMLDYLRSKRIRHPALERLLRVRLWLNDHPWAERAWRRGQALLRRFTGRDLGNLDRV